MQLSKPREEERKASDVDCPVFCRRWRVSSNHGREGVELVKAEWMVGEEDELRMLIALGQITATNLIM